MNVYLCALNLYRKAMFSSKKTFQGFIPIIITPIDNTNGMGFIFSGEITEELEKSFWLTVIRKFPLDKIEAFINSQRPDIEDVKGRQFNIFQIIEKAPCVAKQIEIGVHMVNIKGRAKYLNNFKLEYQKDISKQHGQQIWKLYGDIQIEDFVSDIFDTSRMRKRMSFASKVMDL